MPTKTDPFSGPLWTSEDAQALLTFLQTQAGRRLVFRLRNERPVVPFPKDGVEASAMAAQLISGYEQAVNNILSYLSTPIEDGVKAEVYPDLEGDAGWEEELQSASFGLPPAPDKTTPPTN